MLIIPQIKESNRLFNAISSFFSIFQIGNLLRMYNAQKEKGISAFDIFKYKLCNIFADKSLYIQQRTPTIGF